MRYANSLSFLSLLFSFFSWPMLAQAQSLPAVAGVVYDGQQITWDNLDGATGYNIHLDFDYLTTVGDVDSYTPTGTGRYYVVGYNDAGSYSPLEVITNDIVPLTNFVDVGESEDEGEGETGGTSTGVSSSVGVSNANYDGTNITWDALSDATGYNVHYFFQGAGGWTYLTTVGDVLSYSPQMTGSYNIVGYDDAGNYSAFQIIDGGRTVSTNSATVDSIGTITEPNTPSETPAQGLPAVTGVAYDGSTITWNPVDGATGYNVHIDNFVYLTTLGNVTSYTPEFSAKYFIVGFDDQGNYSPIQIIESNVVPTSNSVEVN